MIYRLIAIFLFVSVPVVAQTKPPTIGDVPIVENTKANPPPCSEAAVLKARNHFMILESQLRRLQGEAKQAKILEHKTETLPQYEARVAHEKRQRVIDEASGAIEAVILFLLSLFGVGQWRGLSMKERLRRVIEAVNQSWSATELESENLRRSTGSPLSSAEKNKRGHEIAAELFATPELRVRRPPNLDPFFAAKSTQTKEFFNGGPVV